MASEKQKQLRLELDERLPRGPKGSLQNELRQRVYFFRNQGHNFENSLELAVKEIRLRDPGFAPTILGQAEVTRPLSGADKRATPRYHVKPGSFAYYRVEGSRTSNPISDLSLGGLFVTDPKHQFTPGAEIEVGLGLGKDMLLAKGIVVRAVPGRGFAVQFRDLSAATREKLEAHVSKLSELAL